MSEAPPLEPHGFETVTGSVAFALRAADVIRAARMELAIFSHDLDRRIYATEAVVGAIRTFALAHRRARVRVIVHSPSMSGGNRLVDLGRMLSSRIEFRQLLDERKQTLLEEYLLADERSLLYKDAYDRIDARYWADAPLEARSRLRAFSALWEECVPAQEYRVLGI